MSQININTALLTFLSTAKDTENDVTTSPSLKVGGKKMYSIERLRTSKSGDNTVIKVADFQTAKTTYGKGTTIVRSLTESQSSGAMRGKRFDFKCMRVY